MIFFKYLPHTYQGADYTGRRVLNFGGGGGGPTTSTVNQSNIPEWLRPQTEALLGAGMQEYFNTEFNPETGTYDITGTKPYTPYSADPRDYVAGFSPQQQQVFGEAAGMQTPGGFQTGSQLAGAGATGGMQSTGAAFGYGGQGAGYGGQGAMFGQQAAGTGSMYERMATDPMSMQAYMSPYMQNVVEIQKQQAIEDAQRSQLGANLGAARQGTYGGARQTLAQTQREAGLNKQLSDIQAQGLQSAFDQAQKSQQFGVTSGLQGLQAGISGAQTGIQGAGMGLQGVQAAQAGYGMGIQGGQAVGQLATQQQQADLSRLGFQGQMGDIQQQQQQRITDQAIQDYALSQEMPMQRLAGFNALLRGYATPVTTTSQYQAPANPLQTIGALGTAAGGFGTLMGGGKKAGGAIKLAKGGITDVDAIEGMAEDLSIPQIQQSMQNETLPKYVGMPILEQKVAEAERMKMAQAMMGQQGQQESISDALMAKADQLQGITDIAEPAPVMAAGGGVVAFQAGGLSLSDVMRQATPQEQRDYQRTGVLSTRLQNLMAAQTMPQKGSDKADIEAVLAEAEAGRGPNVQRVSTDPKTQNKQLVAAPAPAPPTSATAGNEAIASMADTTGFGLSPPELESKPQGITSIVEPTRQEEVEQYLKERAAIMGEDEYLKALKDRAKKEPSIYDRLSSAGAQIGLAGSMLRDPGQFGAYAKQAAELQGAQRKSAEERELAFLAAQRAERETKGKAFDVVEGRRQEAAKAETERKFKSKEAELTRQAQITAANIAAGKPTDMRYYANMKLRAQRGDKEAITIVNAVETYLPLAGLGRVGVAQQQANIAETKVNVDLYNKAVEYTDSQIGRSGPRNTEYRKLQEKDKENAAKGNPTTLAEDLENSIRNRYIANAQVRKQAKPGAAPAGGQGAPARTSLPPAAVSMLKANPSDLAKQQFDYAFGPGAAARALANK
jgi:hypothetical protein